MLERLKQKVSAFSKARRWYIAYSGGLDSHSLLHCLSLLKAQEDSLPELIAVHVNHQLQSDADNWEVHCQKKAEDLSVGFLSFKVTIATNNNLEAKAREARYQVFTELIQEGDCLFLGHHQQDQIETFFYRLFRGAGLKGLSAIKRERPFSEGTLVRPMLEFTREEIAAYALHHNLDYIQDPSNEDTVYDRNYIRHQLLPVIQQRWPAYSSAVKRAISHSEESVALLEDLAKEDLSCFEVSLENEIWLGLQTFDTYSLRRQKNLLRYWLEQHQVLLTERQLMELINHVIAASEDANPQLCIGDRVLRRFQKKLYITSEDCTLEFAAFEWHGETSCIVAGYGELSLSKPVDIILRVLPRKGGEVIKPVGSEKTRKLKTLLQEMQIPPWRRQGLPLIYFGEELIAVGDMIRSETAEKWLGESTIICD